MNGVRKAIERLSAISADRSIAEKTVERARSCEPSSSLRVGVRVRNFRSWPRRIIRNGRGDRI